MTYESWYGRYIEVYKISCKPRTLEEYNRLHRSLIAPVLGPIELGDISPEDVQLCLNAAAARGERTADAVYTLIRAVMRRAVRSRLLSWSPVEAVDRPEHDQEPGKQLTRKDLEAAAPHIREELALSLALYAGLRRGEIAGLRWGDIDLEARLLRIRRQRQRIEGRVVTAEPKSNAGCRDIPIDPELLQLLRQRFELRPNAWVIPHAPEYPGNCWRRIQASTVHLSQKYRLHDLRHTYGSQLILRGTNLKVVSYLMGHSSLEVTLRVYSHVYADQVEDEMLRVYGETSLTRR